MSSTTQEKNEPPSPGAALVALRWKKSKKGDAERLAIGEKLAKARKKISKKRRKEIARKAAEARWSKAREQAN